VSRPAGESGLGQRWDPESYARNARFVSNLGRPVLSLLAARPGERILDLGCGDGALALELVEAGAQVVALDASAAQVSAACARGLDARLGDAAALDFDGEFDAVFSNAVLHWVRDADAVIDGVWRALRPGGRFVGEMGGDGNVDSLRAALHAALSRRGVDPAAVDPWYFPTTEDYAGRLRRRGFAVEEIALIPRPTPLPGDLADWLATFAQPFLMAVPEAARGGLVAEVTVAVGRRLRDAEGCWTVDYRRLRFRAGRPGSA